jgi:hypothetical protein
MGTSFSGGRSRSTWREPPTMSKQLVNFITCGCELSAPFFVIYKAVLVIGLYEDNKVIITMKLKMKLSSNFIKISIIKMNTKAFERCYIMYRDGLVRCGAQPTVLYNKTLHLLLL